MGLASIRSRLLFEQIRYASRPIHHLLKQCCTQVYYKLDGHLFLSLSLSLSLSPPLSLSLPPSPLSPLPPSPSLSLAHTLSIPIKNYGSSIVIPPTIMEREEGLETLVHVYSCMLIMVM